MIRLFSLSDLDSVLQIESHSFPKSPYHWETFLRFHMLHPDTFLVCCNRNRSREEMLGYIIYSHDGHIISIAVHPGYRRKGIGTRLIRKAMDTPHIKKVWAEVRKSNLSAQSFYSKLEFKTVGTVPNYYGNEDALIVQWNPDLTR